MMLGMAEVFVLLLGEIDLSIGFSAAIGAVFTFWVRLRRTWPWTVAVPIGMASPGVFGVIQAS